MGAWSSRGATGWCRTPGLVVNNNGVVVKACREKKRLRRGGGRGPGQDASCRNNTLKEQSIPQAEPGRGRRHGQGLSSVFSGIHNGGLWRVNRKMPETGKRRQKLLTSEPERP